MTIGSYIQKKHQDVASSQDSFMKNSRLSDVLSKLGKKQSFYQTDIESFTGNCLEFAYFISFQ